MGNARRAALTALERCRRSGAWSDAVLGAVMDSEGLETRDRALAAALCYGVMQTRLTLDYYISCYSSVKPGRIEPKVFDILRLSAYQILHMDRIPVSAAVNEGVELCRSSGFARASGFVNAVLRKIAANKNALPEIKADTKAERLSLSLSYPLWLVREIIAALGEDEAESFLTACNAPADVTIQVNTLKTDTERLAESLRSSGIEVRKHPFLPDCLCASETGSITALEEFKQGMFYIQDAAARLSVEVAGIKAGDKVLDCCAAPGGKSFAAALSCGDKAGIVACDIHDNKLERIKQGASRLGITGISTVARDAREYKSEWINTFDVVIADVPCSGLGVIRKKPDIRYKAPEGLAALPEIQKAILRSVSEYVRPGGVLIYSTCTVLWAENRGVTESFLRDNDKFKAEDFAVPCGASEGGCLQLWPQRHGTDGFFIARMRKRS